MGVKGVLKEKLGVQHPLDVKNFETYPSPIWEACMKEHPSYINHTTPFFGPLLYWLIRNIGAHCVVEIGIAQAYTSYFMAHAIRDNNVRYQMKGKYIAVDIANLRPIFDPYIAKGWPIEFWHMDSLNIETRPGKLEPGKLPQGEVDLVFQDGWHNTEHCKKELEIIWPALKDKGQGWLVMHDTVAWCEEYWKEFKKMTNLNFNYINLFNNYGLAICQKMDNYDGEKVMWPDGDQKNVNGVQNVPKDPNRIDVPVK